MRRFEDNLDAILSELQSAGLPIIASTIAVNEKDWEPNRSILRDPRSEKVAAIELDDAERAIERGDDAAALDSLRRVQELEPGYAWAWFRSGECLRRLGRNAEARAHFAHAVDEDANPYRETSEQTRILRETCARRGVDLIDAMAVLESASADGMIGFDSMWDNCHPTLEGYLRIADEYAARIVERFGATKVHAATEVDALRAALGIGDADDVRVLGTRGQYCYLASTLTWNPAARLERARRYLAEAVRKAPEDPNLACSFGILEAMCGNAEASRTAWKRAFSIDPDGTRARSYHSHVRQLLGRIGVTDPESLFAD
ncbi:MAG: tetratricopeptide repeat protein [Planctomycetes bacterium]|nr:tetratricopeptide repeat protein [Planctomycetota bacterium]